MELHLPGGGSLFESLFTSDATALARGTGGDATIPDVTPIQLDEALAALARGDIEYLALHDGETFVQVAGEGVGPYQLEYNPGSLADQVIVPSGVTDEGARHALHGFLGRDPAWAQPFTWQNAGLGDDRPPGRGLFGRLFGRG